MVSKKINPKAALSKKKASKKTVSRTAKSQKTGLKKLATQKIVSKQTPVAKKAAKKGATGKIKSGKIISKAATAEIIKLQRPKTVAGPGRPLFVDIEANYPGEGKSAGDVYKLIGGKVALNYHMDPDTGEESNSCTLRVCRGLNYGGAKIKMIDRTILYGTGGDGLKYIYRVIDMIKQLVKTFGQPGIARTPADPDYRSAFEGHKGIIAFRVSGWGDATGHVTTWDGNSCGYHCYFDEADYINAGSGVATTVKVMLWMLN
ncbi:MAG: type VI secretion system amidase effector protein Tae4 [Ginsengibacter sp.]